MITEAHKSYSGSDQSKSQKQEGNQLQNDLLCELSQSSATCYT